VKDQSLYFGHPKLVLAWASSIFLDQIRRISESIKCCVSMAQC